MAIPTKTPPIDYADVREIAHVSNFWNIVVYDPSDNDYMATYDHDSSEPWSTDTAFLHVYEYLKFEHGFDPATQRAYVYAPEKFLQKGAKPVEGVDFKIKEVKDLKRNNMLFCKREQLSVGDVVQTCTGFETMTESHPFLVPRLEQGYYRFRITGGDKHQAFMLNPDAVAEWGHFRRCWHWKGYNNNKKAIKVT